MSFVSLSAPAAVLALALSSPAAMATTFTLDFSGNICGASGTSACGNGSTIGQNYGDVAGELDVIYDADRDTAGTSNVFHWGGGYETLSNVAYGTNGRGGLSILFQPLTGFQVTLTGFDIAPYANRERNTLVQIIDTQTNALLVDETFAPLPTGEVTSFSGIWNSASGIQINLGPDAWDVGISNITGSVTRFEPPSAIPLPAAGWLMLAGLGGLAALRRRKTTV